MPSEKIGLPPEVAAALERVRVGGRTNMRDVPQVLALLVADEALDAADWCLTSSRLAANLTHGRMSPGGWSLPHRNCYPDRYSGAREDALDGPPSGGSRSTNATGSSQWGHCPPGPMRRQNCWHSAHRCCPR